MSPYIEFPRDEGIRLKSYVQFPPYVVDTAVGGTSFNPNSITGLIWWGDPSDASTINTGSPVDNDKVSLWKDKSSSGNDATQNTSTAQFIYNTNIFGSLPGLKVVRANSTYMQLTTQIATLTSFTFIMVFELTAGAGGTGNAMLSSSNTLPGHGGGPCYCPFLRFSDGLVEVYDGNNAPNEVFDSTIPSIANNTRYIISVQSATKPPDSIFRVNNTSQALTSSAGAAWAMGWDYIGNNGASIDGYFGETLIYNNSISDSDMTSIYNYLVAKGW